RLVVVRPTGQDLHRRGGRERRGPQRFKVDGRIAKDTAVKVPAGRGEGERDVVGGTVAGSAGYDGVEPPGIAAVARNVDRGERTAHRIGGEGSAHDLERAGRVDGDARLAVLVGFPAQRARDHVDDRDGCGGSPRR